MNKIIKVFIYVFLIFLVVEVHSVRAGDDSTKTFLIDLNSLSQVKLSLGSGNSQLSDDLNKLIFIADSILTIDPMSVMDKTGIPPSGDKHDYMSVGPYWWPDPDSNDGLPYIRKDGESNPERGNYDSARLKLLQYHVSMLSLAYFYTDHQPYAKKAAVLIRTWFLDPATKMNPNLNYAQAIPGRTEGRGIGIIDTRKFGEIIDAIGILESSNSWSTDDTEKMKTWFKDYLEWLLTSENGMEEAAWYNNHGTWYDVQAVHIALFVGDIETAVKIVNKVPAERISSQIEPDGSQPHELKRTRSFNYSAMNLIAMFRLAKLAEFIKINLWDYESKDGRSIKKALDYLIPFAVGEKKWKHEMIRGWTDGMERMFILLRIASRKYEDIDYELMTNKLEGVDKDNHLLNLLYPSIKIK